MKEVWIVNMGIGENATQREAMRVFSNKRDAVNWVRNHFQEQIKTLDNLAEHMGINIGNSFYIYRMDVLEKTGLRGT
ncbi:MAG: hypothetical protein GF315_09785 [candidate division Zixibacteria bacterium]|nr:hypothetical protein [candidate division Zixibacteria bacterium]